MMSYLLPSICPGSVHAAEGHRATVHVKIRKIACAAARFDGRERIF